MRRRLLVLAVVVSVACAAIGAAPAAAEEPGLSAEARRQAAALRDAAGLGTGAYELLRSLTVEAAPRFAGTPGDRAGVEWGLETMRRLGFDNVRAEPVTVPQWVRGEEAGWILDPSLRPVVLAALGGSVGTPPPDLTAEVVPVLDLDALEALPDEAVAGKVVFFTRRMERNREGSGYRPTVRARGAGPSAAAAKGAVAMLMRYREPVCRSFRNTSGVLPLVSKSTRFVLVDSNATQRPSAEMAGEVESPSP